MAEWHLPPGYIMDNWTDELFDLMVEKLIERKQREASAMQPSTVTSGHRVSDSMLFAGAKNLIRVVKKN